MARRYARSKNHPSRKYSTIKAALERRDVPVSTSVTYARDALIMAACKLQQSWNVRELFDDTEEFNQGMWQCADVVETVITVMEYIKDEVERRAEHDQGSS